MANSEGLGIGYRLGWNIRRIVMTFFGPAQLGEDDPMERLTTERRQKSAEALAKKNAK